jgi:type III secretion system FlhB-like substrate exporter
MTNRVVGLSCDLDEAAPTVILKGAGAEAQEILDRARQLADVPIVKDPELVRELYRLPLDAPIGRELFPVMAAVLADIIRTDRSWADAAAKQAQR